MEAEKKAGLVLFGKGDAIREGELDIVGPGQQDDPAIADEQRLQPARQIQRVFLLEMAVDHVRGADIGAAMAGIDDDDAVRFEMDRVVEQGHEVLSHVERMDEGMAVDQ